MKIFFVTANLQLTKKPTWLDAFRKQYDKPYQYHLTLKQPCFIEDNDVADVKNKLKELFLKIDTSSPKLIMTFNTLKVSKNAPGGICIMINAQNSKNIYELQKDVVHCLSSYSNYYKAKYQSYETRFEPHITIGRDLNESTFATASKQLTQDYTCIGRILNVTLTVVKNFAPQEINNLENQTIL